jgi:adenine-specific DNA-methyltransferase
MEFKPGWGAPRRPGILGDGRREAVGLWRRWVAAAHRAARPDTAHVVFGTWRSPWMHTVLAKHFRVRACLVWRKRPWGGGYWIRPQWEMAFVLFKGRPPRRGPDVGDVWDFPRILRPRHPCEKPVALLRQAIELVTDPGQLVADPFSGIASTGVAALESGRRFLGIELDPRHHRLGLARLRAAVVADKRDA